MKRRIAIWAAVGFLVASCWVVYTFVAPPDSLFMNPAVQAAVYLTCPISYVGRHYHHPMSWRLFVLINAATYAVVGLILELSRSGAKPRVAA